MPTVVLLVLIGAAAGYAAHTYGRLEMRREVAIAAGAFGGLIGGFALKFLLSFVGALIGAVAGAALLLFIAQLMSKR